MWEWEGGGGRERGEVKLREGVASCLQRKVYVVVGGGGGMKQLPIDVL